MAKRHISAVISLKDNMSATMRGIRKEQSSFQKEVKATRLAMESVNKQKMKARLDTSAAGKAFKELKKNILYIEAKKKLVQMVALKDMASAKISNITKNISKIGKAIATPVIKAKDSATAAINKVSATLKTIAKGVIIPLTVATGGAVAALKGGAELEQQQISMEHFMGVGNKDKNDVEVKKMSEQYLVDLRNNANATPFETGEVIAAGTRALQISGGDTKEAMEKVKLAEDMAALNPGKTISDAMEALADMEMGEYARLTEFGVKATNADGDTPEGVQKQLSEMYTGGAEKLATSATGLLSTITGKLKSNLADIGQSMLEPMKPAMEGVIGIIDQLTPKMLSVGESLGQGVMQAIEIVNSVITTLQPMFTSVFSTIQTSFSVLQPIFAELFTTIKATFEPMLPLITNVFNTAFTTIQNILAVAIPIVSQAISALSPVFEGLLIVAQTVMSGIGIVIQAAAPIISNILSGLTPVFEFVGSCLTSLGGVFTNTFEGIKSVVEFACPFVSSLINGLTQAFDFVKEAVNNVGGVFSSVFEGIKSTVSSAYDFIKPLIDGIGSMVSNIGGAVGNGVNWVKSKFDKNATGTQYFRGGVSLVGEHGPELVEMPNGSKVYTNRETKNIFKEQNEPQTENIKPNTLKPKNIKTEIKPITIKEQNEPQKENIKPDTLKPKNIKTEIKPITLKEQNEPQKEMNRSNVVKEIIKENNSSISNKNINKTLNENIVNNDNSIRSIVMNNNKDNSNNIVPQKPSTSLPINKLDNHINNEKNNTKNENNITIAKIADSIVIREENDIDKIAAALVRKINEMRAVTV